MEKARAVRPGTVAMGVFGAAAMLLYGWFLSVNLPDVAGGEAKYGQAMEALTALTLLWLVLIVLVIIDRALGGASWTRRAGFVLVPVAAIANVFATDYPNDRLCQIAVLGLPLLTGLYVLLGRLPKRRTAGAQAVSLLVMSALSAYAIDLFVT